MINILSKIENSAELVAELVSGNIITELQGQGHVNTRKLLESIEPLNRFAYNIIQVDIMVEDYYVYVEYGVKATQIKHKFAKARIYALREWWINHGLDFNEATSAAYATAAKHAKEGMPTQNSWRHSENGRRLHFLDESIDDNKYIAEYETTLEDILEEAGYSMLDNLPFPFKISKN